MVDSPNTSPFTSFGRKVDEHLNGVGPRMEDEVHKVIAYLNDEVVPAVRRNSSEALRTAAAHLGRLAEHLEKPGGARPSSKPSSSPIPGQER